jgi:hypothetical protein
MVIAPGVDEELATYDVVVLVTLSGLTSSEVLSTNAHVEEDVRLPFAQATK